MHVKTIELASCGSEICIPSLTTTVRRSCEVCESFDFGSSLQNVHPLLRFVFKYLGYADLKSAGKINDTWGKYAEEELARRNGLSWLCLTKLQRQHILERSANFMYDEVTFSLVFYKNTRVMLYGPIYLHSTEQHREESFVDYLTTEALPKGTKFWTLSCSHVSHAIDKVSPNKSKSSLFSILSIPSIPHVAIRRFFFSETEPTDMRNILEENVRSDEIIDCLLVFNMSGPEYYMETVMHEILRRQKADTIALGGGVMDSINVYSNTFSFFPENKMCCIAFARKRDTPADFEAFSLMIKKGDDEFEAKVSDFRSRIFLRRNSFIIRVCHLWKDHSETETPLICKYFPQTAVFGFMTSGVIGWNRLPRGEDKCRDAEDDTPKKKKSKVYTKMWQQHTTVLVLITWGPKV